MKKFVLGLSAALVALGTAGALCAAAPAATPGATPARPDAPGHRHGMDMDGDGAVTWAEAKAHADALWARLDVNQDGKIDQADRDARELKRFDAIDTNHDGSISREEFLAHVRTMKPGMGQPGMGQPGMDRDRGPEADKDGPPPPPPGDGADMPPPPPGGMEHGMHHGMGRGMGGRPEHGFLPMFADGLDKDGTITRAQYDAAVKSRFDKADTNHDGKLTRDEIRAAFPRPEGGPHGPQRDRDGERRDPQGAPPPAPAAN